jgi:hypothetical protein
MTAIMTIQVVKEFFITHHLSAKRKQCYVYGLVSLIINRALYILYKVLFLSIEKATNALPLFIIEKEKGRRLDIKLGLPCCLA